MERLKKQNRRLSFHSDIVLFIFFPFGISKPNIGGHFFQGSGTGLIAGNICQPKAKTFDI